jgi:hypothetical protein
MTDTNRFKLLGTYSTPCVRIGAVLSCEARDEDVIVTGYTAARIPWPVGRRTGTSARSLVVYGDLAESVGRESNQAVCYRFGVTPQNVMKWRKTLEVGRTSDSSYPVRPEGMAAVSATASYVTDASNAQTHRR